MKKAKIPKLMSDTFKELFGSDKCTCMRCGFQMDLEVFLDEQKGGCPRCSKFLIIPGGQGENRTLSECQSLKANKPSFTLKGAGKFIRKSGR